jgi:hypothetical protein
VSISNSGGTNIFNSGKCTGRSVSFSIVNGVVSSH